MLGQAKAAGWDAIGVEPSEFAARYASQHSECQVYHGTLQHVGFEAASFDVLTLMDVIEHVPEPCDLMAEVYRVLRPNGIVFLTTPNFGSIFVRLYGPKAYGIGPDEHVTYFQPTTVKRLLRRSGFTKTIIGTKDLYAENLRRLFGHRNAAASSQIKGVFSERSPLGNVRNFVNRIFMHVPLGDKLIALAQK
jgi:SAM-dependent methyltransferase